VKQESYRIEKDKYLIKQLWEGHKKWSIDNLLLFSLVLINLFLEMIMGWREWLSIQIRLFKVLFLIILRSAKIIFVAVKLKLSLRRWRWDRKWGMLAAIVISPGIVNVRMFQKVQGVLRILIRRTIGRACSIDHKITVQPTKLNSISKSRIRVSRWSLLKIRCVD